MGCSPSYFHPSSLFSCEGIHLYRSVRREVEEGARGCARVCVRAWRPSGSVFAFISSSPKRVSGRRGSLSGSPGRPPTALTAAHHLRPLLLPLRPRLQRALCCSPARPLALSPAARSRWLRTLRLSRPGEAEGPLSASGDSGPRQPQARAGSRRAAEWAVIGGGARAGRARAGVEPVPPICPARGAARTGSSRARGSPAAERTSFRMHTPGSLASDAAGRAARPQVSVPGCAGLGRRRWADVRPCCAPLEAGLISERKAGGDVRAEFPLASPSYCVLP